MKVQKGAIMITVLILVAFLFYCVFAPAYSTVDSSKTVTGKVINVEYSAGGFGHSDLTAIYLENGYSFALSGIYTLQIGKDYVFYYNAYGVFIKFEQK